MFDLILENKSGNRLTFEMGSPFQVTEIVGLNPPTATINMSDVAMIDGAVFNSSKLQTRLINVAFAIVEEPPKNRIEVYRVLKTKQPVRLFYKGDFRNVYIDGYVESIDISYFEMIQVVTVAILCPDPYLKNAEEITEDLNSIVSRFHFPFASTEAPQIVFGTKESGVTVEVPNNGDVECGMIIELHAAGALANPKVYDYDSQEWIGLNIEMIAGDEITLDTRQGHKTATLLRDGIETSVFNKVLKNSTWLQLPPNGGKFYYQVEIGLQESLTVVFKHSNLFEGV